MFERLVFSRLRHNWGIVYSLYLPRTLSWSTEKLQLDVELHYGDRRCRRKWLWSGHESYRIRSFGSTLRMCDTNTGTLVCNLNDELVETDHTRMEKAIACRWRLLTLLDAFDTIPTQIITSILMSSSRTVFLPPQHDHFLWKLGHVCSHWREIVWYTQGFWSTIWNRLSGMATIYKINLALIGRDWNYRFYSGLEPPFQKFVARVRHA